MIRTEESKQAWQVAQTAGDWATVDAIEAEWETMARPEEKEFDSFGDESNWDWDFGDEKPWTNEDEDALEEWEEQRRARWAEASEY